VQSVNVVVVFIDFNHSGPVCLQAALTSVVMIIMDHASDLSTSRSMVDLCVIVYIAVHVTRPRFTVSV